MQIPILLNRCAQGFVTTKEKKNGFTFLTPCHARSSVLRCLLSVI